MNKQFLELFNKAIMEQCLATGDVDNSHAILERFAELIVRQAADMFEVEYGSSEGLSGNRVAAVLKQYFGVEE